MPSSKYLDIKIAGREVEITDPADFPFSINFKREDREDFQRKPSSQAFNVKLPPTLQNQQIANSFHNTAVNDNTPGQLLRSHQPLTVISAGINLMTGKAFLVNAEKTNVPEAYEFSFYGDNADWMIDLKEKTLFDFLQHITFTFSESNVLASLNFDGTNESIPYVFAPVKYRGFMDVVNQTDSNVTTDYLRPSISCYWIIYWAFKSLGYRVSSSFMDSDFFRRLVMPWSWGNFLDSDGTKLQIHKFLAKSANDVYIDFTYHMAPLDANVVNDSTDGAFDNNNEYSYVGGSKMTWEYKNPNYGALQATLSVTVNYQSSIVGENSACGLYIKWFHYDASAGTTTQFFDELIFFANGRNFVITQNSDIKTMYATHDVEVGDKIIAELWLNNHEGGGIGARSNIIVNVLQYQMEYFRIPIGGTINFDNYLGLKKHKFLEYFAGIVDLFNLEFATDPINKVVYIEPEHEYSSKGLLSVKSPGFMKNDFINWDDKRDLSDKWKVVLFSDYEREVRFKFKEDGNDGILKVLQDRHVNTLASGKYVFPSRFKAGKKDCENRFFAATTHYEVPQFKSITGIAPQLVCMIPENISNTSNSESSNTFVPKICWYKGQVGGVGGWKFNGTNRTTLPFMFSVNYKNGTKDPVLSYGDELIGNSVIPGLLKRFYWQRLAIMRNGQYLQGKLYLNNTDVSRIGHREYKIIEGQRMQLMEIESYEPLNDQSTTCHFKKWAPLIEYDFDNTFPSADSVNGTVTTMDENDTKYAKLLALNSDIPAI